jgi:hypothetical protein
MVFSNPWSPAPVDRPVMQRRLITRTGGLGTPAGRQGVGVGASVDQEPDDLRAVGKVAWPVCDQVQGRRRAGFLAAKPGRRQRGMTAQQSLDRLDVTGMYRQTQLGRDLVVVGDPLARLLVTHRGPSCQPTALLPLLLARASRS